MTAAPATVRPPSTVAGLLAQWYGSLIRTRRVLSDFTVTTTASRIVTTDSSRCALNLQNTSSLPLVIGFTPAITSTTGIVLMPQANLQFIWFEDLDFQCQEVWAISPAGSPTVHVIEQLLIGEYEESSLA